MMKLILCKKCSDIFSLKYNVVKECSCGDSGGVYVDNIDAHYWGEHAQILGFTNGTLVKAVKDQIALGDRNDAMGREFKAFLIPNYAPSIKKIDRPEALPFLNKKV